MLGNPFERSAIAIEFNRLLPQRQVVGRKSIRLKPEFLQYHIKSADGNLHRLPGRSFSGRKAILYFKDRQLLGMKLSDEVIAADTTPDKERCFFSGLPYIFSALPYNCRIDSLPWLR